MEYKSPDDKVNIDTFYKVLSYACLYKSDTGAVDEILDTDITITLIRERKPKKLLGQLQNKDEVTKKGKGIYRIEGMLFPMQIIVTKELEKRSHVWLRSLTRSMDRAQAEELLDRYERLQDDVERKNAKVVVNLVSDVNSGIFEQIVSGGDKMSEELKAILLPELNELKNLLANREAELAGKDTELAKKSTELAEKNAKLAESEVVIAELERKLAAAMAENNIK